MNKIIKAQAGAAAIPIKRIFPSVAEVIPKSLPIGKIIPAGVPGIIASIFYNIITDKGSANPAASERHGKQSVAAPDATWVARPVVVPRGKYNLHLGKTRAIPIAGQSSTATPVMAKKKKKKVAVGQEQETPRDTVRVTNGAAVENATPQDTVKTQHENTEQTADDRNILQRLGDRWARRKAKNSKPKTENPPTNPPQENKGLVKRGFGYIKEHPIKSTLIGGPVVFLIGPKPAIKAWDVTSGIIKNRAKAWSFEEDEDKNKTRNIDANKSTEPVQNDTTQAYNGFLINQQNLVE